MLDSIPDTNVDIDANVLGYLRSGEIEIIRRAEYIVDNCCISSDSDYDQIRCEANKASRALSNLRMNLQYHTDIIQGKYNARKFDLWEEGKFAQYKSSKSEREKISEARDPELGSISLVLSKLSAISEYLESLNWRLIRVADGKAKSQELYSR